METRTDTHGIEAYSNLPTEFQEIARRLARQDKHLRDVTGGSSHPRSRLSSRSSRGGSPREQSPTRTGNLAKYSRISVSSSSLASGASPKKRRPSVHPRPVTPSLSRSHPATSCTLYDSRSRPSSRQASRSSSPVRSRNSSPNRGGKSRSSLLRIRERHGVIRQCVVEIQESLLFLAVLLLVPVKTDLLHGLKPRHVLLHGLGLTMPVLLLP